MDEKQPYITQAFSAQTESPDAEEVKRAAIRRVTERRRARAERAHRMLQLRLAGLTMRAIGKAEGTSAATVSKNIDWALTEVYAQEARQVRALSQARLESLFGGLWIKAKAGDVQAIGMLLRILERQAKMYGIDVTRVEFKASAAAPDDSDRDFDAIAKAMGYGPINQPASKQVAADAGSGEGVGAVEPGGVRGAGK